MIGTERKRRFIAKWSSPDHKAQEEWRLSVMSSTAATYTNTSRSLHCYTCTTKSSQYRCHTCTAALSRHHCLQSLLSPTASIDSSLPLQHLRYKTLWSPLLFPVSCHYSTASAPFTVLRAEEQECRRLGSGRRRLSLWIATARE